MRRLIAWIVVALIVILLVGVVYVLADRLPDLLSRPTPTPTKTPTMMAMDVPTNTPPPETTTEPPTNTPPPVVATPTDAPTAMPTPEAPTATPTPRPTTLARPAAGLERVNIRSGPGTNFDTIGQLEQGQTMEVIGQNLGTTPTTKWWRVCCLNGQAGWARDDVVTIEGPTDDIPITVDGQASAPPTNTPPPAQAPAATNTPPPPTNTPPPAFAFRLEETQSYVNGNPYVTIWAKIYRSGATPEPLSGYRLRVLKNGAVFGERDSTTIWRDSAPPGFPNAVKYNVDKFETAFEAGTWTVYVVDGSGRQVSPEVTFQTSGDSTQREFYVGFVQ